MLLCPVLRMIPSRSSSLIFRLTNAGEYMQRRQRGQNLNPRGVSLTAFSRDGKILLPIKKDAKMREKARVADQNREKLIEAARRGDESAIEALNNEDMGMYNSLTRRMMKEDIYSIVESCFMPQGIECDIYQENAQHRADSFRHSGIEMGNRYIFAQ